MEPTGARGRSKGGRGSDAPATERSVVSPRGEQFEVLGRAGPVELRGAPAIRAEAREELLVIKDGELFLCARTDGDVLAGRASGEGLYAHDTRYLSEIRCEVGDVPPVALSHTVVGDRAIVDSTNAGLRRGAQPEVPQQSLAIGRELMCAAGRLYYRVRVHNFLPEPVGTTLSLVVAGDFADIFEVRGGPLREARGQVLAPKRIERGVVLAYVGEDEVFREAVVEFDPQPTEVELGAERVRAQWEVALEPGAAVTVLMTAEPSIAGRRRPRRRLERAVGELERASSEWESRCTRIASDNELFEGLTAKSRRDLRALVVPAPGGRIVSAGIPWYVAPFGRDALLTASEALLLTPTSRATRSESWRSSRRPRTTPGATPSRARSCTSCASASSRGRGCAAHAVLRHGRRDAAVPGVRGGLLRVDGRPADAARAATRARRRAALDRRVTATATATGSSSTSAARPAACATRGGRTPTTRSCTPTARSPRARSRSWRCRATSTGRS